MREELGIPLHGPLCPWTLASHLGYVVEKLSTFADSEPAAVSYLQSNRGQSEFSAVTLYHGRNRIIIHNDAHHQRRQAANVAHELAHGLLCHAPAALTGSDGARTFNREREGEANWLGPALLISDEAAVFIANGTMTTMATCEAYGVSDELLQMRLRVTEALIRVGRSGPIRPSRFGLTLS